MSIKEEHNDLIKRVQGKIDLDPKEFDQGFKVVVSELHGIMFKCLKCGALFPQDSTPHVFSREILKHKFIIDEEAEAKYRQEHFLNPRKPKLGRPSKGEKL